MRKTTRREKIVICSMFAAMIYLPALASLFSTAPTLRLQEKRQLAQGPDFPSSFEALLRYPDEFTDYYNDHFGLRTFLTITYNYASVSLFNKSPLASVTVGADGWLFYAADGALAAYTAKKLFTKDDEAELEKRLALIKKELQKRNIIFAIMIAPNKNTIYPEYMPNGIPRYNTGTRYDQFIALCKRVGVPFIDIRGELAQGKGKAKMYNQHGTHWTDAGAYIAYEKILTVISKNCIAVRYSGAISLFSVPSGRMYHRAVA